MEKFPDRSRIAAVQLRKLRALLAAILPANAFYARKLANSDLKQGLASVTDFSRIFPFTTRHELVRDRLENPPYGTDLTYPLDSYVRCHQTSGTTTVPIRWLDTHKSWTRLTDNWVQIFAAAGINGHDRFFFAFQIFALASFRILLKKPRRSSVFMPSEIRYAPSYPLFVFSSPCLRFTAQCNFQRVDLCSRAAKVVS